MSRKLKIWLIAAASLIIVGVIIFAGVMTVFGWDFTELSTNKYVTNLHDINEDFSNISIKTKTADVLLLPSDDGVCRVGCYEDKNMKHSVMLKDGTLSVEVVDTRKWYNHIGINFGTPKIMVYLPRSEYGSLSVKSDTGDVEIPQNFTFDGIDISVSTGDVKCLASTAGQTKIKTNTGHIRVEDVSADALDLSVSTGSVTANAITCEGDVKVKVSTGDAKLTDVTCKTLVSSGSTGDISLKSVIAVEKFTVQRSTGDVKFDGCDAAELFVKTDTGDVEGTLLSDKVFIVQTDTGDINVPKTTTGGRCEITTDTGDIELTIKG